ncbi:MAG: hypothetical protein MHM6MM_003344 [Cercozoa sp. M6MM]
MDHLPGFVREPLEGLSEAAGFPSDQIVLLLCLVSAVPLGWLLKQVKNASARNLLAFSTGVLFEWLLLGHESTLLLLALTACVYCLIAKLRVSPGIVSFFTMAVLSTVHIYRMKVDWMGWKVDLSAPLMIFTAKYITCAFDLSDGRKMQKKEQLAAKPHIHEQRVKTAYNQDVTILQFFSFVFFFGGALAGPAFRIREYIEFMDGTGDWAPATLKRVTNFKASKGSQVPTMAAALKCLFKAGCAFVGVFLSMDYFSNSWLETSWFTEVLPAKSAIFGASTVAAVPVLAFVNALVSRIVQIVFTALAVSLYRWKYYFAWYLAEAGCVAAGFGMRLVPAEADNDEANAPLVAVWDRSSNGNLLRAELAQSVPALTSNWNVSINAWLKDCVYLRVQRPSFMKGVMSHKGFATMATRVTSAFWHGFYPGYYLFFVSSALLSAADGVGRATLRRFFVTEKENKAPLEHLRWLYNFVGFVFTYTGVNYFGVAFEFLDWRRSVAAWGTLGWWGHWLCPLLVVALPRLFRRKKKRRNIQTVASSDKVETLQDAKKVQ